MNRTGLIIIAMAIKAEGRDALRSDPNRESSIVYSGANYERAYDWNANDGGPPLPGHVYSLLRMPCHQRGKARASLVRID